MIDGVYPSTQEIIACPQLASTLRGIQKCLDSIQSKEEARKNSDEKIEQVRDQSNFSPVTSKKKCSLKVIKNPESKAIQNLYETLKKDMLNPSPE